MTTPLDEQRGRIVRDAERLGPDDTFTFACHPGVSCFNRCCADVNIALTPYDVLRLKHRLGLTSGEFLDRHTILPFARDQRLPVRLLRMGEKPERRCPFVTEAGCGVYEDRPWACRMYPIGLASGKRTAEEAGPEFFFQIREDHCHGWQAGRTWTVRQWQQDQGVAPYDAAGERHRLVTMHDYLVGGGTLEPQKLEMYHLVCYDLDRFRDFVFHSSFLERFLVDEARLAVLKTDDAALLDFGLEWLRFALFSERTMTVRPEVLARAQETRRAP